MAAEADRQQKAEDAHRAHDAVDGGAGEIQVVQQEGLRTQGRGVHAHGRDQDEQNRVDPGDDALGMHAQQLCNAALEARAPHHLLRLQLRGLAEAVEEAVDIPQHANRAAQQRYAHQRAKDYPGLPAHAHGDVLVRVAHRKHGVLANLQPHALCDGRSAKAPELRHAIASLEQKICYKIGKRKADRAHLPVC